jgi:hypothetical protein
VHEDRERQFVLELGRRTGENELTARLGARRELREQARLPDPRLAYQLDRSGLAELELGERVVEQIEFVGASDERTLRACLSFVQVRIAARPGRARIRERADRAR